MINAYEAISIVEKCVRPLSKESVAISNVLNRVLAEDVIADEDVPSFDNAAMDGFAVRSEDVASVPVTLKITGEIPAGIVSSQLLKNDEAMNIMTGAVIPRGCDAVVQQEWTEQVNGAQIKILKPVTTGHNIRKAGTDVKRGSTVLSRGTQLRPPEIGILASLNRSEVSVHKTPVVAILTTGNEVLDVGVPTEPGKIRNSNTYVLSSLAKQCMCTVMDLGIARDEVNDLKRKLQDGFSADMLITSGGVSVGKYDLVKDILVEAGVDLQFQKVNIKPGMPLLFGMKDTTAVFGLPGNPVSSMVTFLKFVKPALLKMSGHRQPHKQMRLRATLAEAIVKNDSKRHFVRGIVESVNGVYHVHTTGPQLSNMLSSLSRANCLITLPEDKQEFLSGDDVEIELI
jgi:molybdopterin molybdotransferase